MLQEIIDSYINGQQKQMVKQIEDYGEGSFFTNLRNEILINGLDKDLFINIATTYHMLKDGE